MAEEPKEVPPDVPAPAQVQVQIPEPHADILYTDQAFVFFTPVGFTIDFAQLTPQAGLTRVVRRIGMSPTHAKLLVQVLQTNLDRYEQQFGVVAITPQMIEQHSRPHQQVGFHPVREEKPA